MGETTRGAKRLGRKRLGGETTRGGNGLGAKRLGFDISDDQVYEWVHFFKGQVYEWGSLGFKILARTPVP